MSTSPTRPLFLGAGGHRFFAQLLPAQGQLKGAAVVCQPWGREGIQTQRMMHCLSRDLAAQGITVLRMELPGCGHGEGDDWQGQRVETWLSAIHEGIDWLRACTQVSHVHLVGLRTSAALAWQVAASRHDVAGLVAMSPTVKGRLYVRELTMLQSTTPAQLRADGSVLEATGFIMTPETQQAFAAIDLMTQGQPAPRVLVLHRDDMPEDARWAQHLTQMGPSVTQGAIDDYVGLLAESARLPVLALQQIVAWVKADTLARVGDNSPLPAVAQLDPDRLSAMTLMVGQTRVIEQALFIPGSTPLFAMCTQAASVAQGAQAPRRAILMLNEGANPVVGPQRMWVQLAREWAAQGYTVLRADLTGLGDSPARPGEEERNIYSNVAVLDMKQALDHLRHQLHAQDITMLGLCSGAYHGFLAAVKGLPIDRAVMINPLVYHWERGMSWNETDVHAHVVSLVEEQTKSAFKLAKWQALMSGKISPAKVSQFIRTRLKTWFKQASTLASQRLGLTLPTRLSWRLGALARRRVPLHLIFAEGEIGLPLLQSEGGKALDRSIQSGMVRIHTLAGGNHVFSDSEPRQRLMQLLHQLLPPEAPPTEVAPSIKGMACSSPSV
jgi:pimeloyl-ACP methyl ester carboxylesterase